MKRTRSARTLKLTKFLAVSLGIPLAGFSPMAQAASLTWDADATHNGTVGGAGTWNTTTSNWDNGTAETTWTNSLADTAVFAGTAGTVTVSGSLNAGGLQFNTTGYTLSSGTITLDAGGINASTLSTGSITVSSPIILNANQSWSVGTGSTLVSSGVISGAATLTKSGTGTLTLNGANTYTGGFVLNAGVINLGASSTGNAGAVTSGPLGTGTATLNGGTLSTNGSARTINNDLLLNSGTTTVGSVSGAGDLTLGGALKGTGVIANNGTGTGATIKFVGDISNFQGTFNLTTYGATNIRFGASSNSTVDGSQAAFAINQGSGSSRNVAVNDNLSNVTLNMGSLSGNGVFEGAWQGGVTNLVIGALGTSTTFSGRLSDSTSGKQANINLTKVGTGSLTLSAANSLYQGTTTVQNGTLVVGNNAASGNSSGSALGFASSAIALGDSTSITNNYSPSLLIGGGFTVGRPITVGANTTTTTGVYTIGGNSSSNAAFSGNIILNQSLNVSQVTNSTGNGLTISGTISSAGATQGVTFSGSGNVRLSAVNTYSGLTLVTGGTLTLTAGSINNSSGITVNGSGAKFVQASSAPSTPAITLTQGTLDGTSAVGDVTVGNSTGGIVSNGNGGTTTLMLNSLTFSGGATANLNFSGTSPALSITNALTTNAVNGLVTLNLTTAPVWSAGTYNLISYGSFSGAISDFVKGTVPGLGARQSATLGITGAGNGFITLTIAGDTPVWTGVASGVWTRNSVGSPYNWKLQSGGTGTEFLDNDQVLFDDSATGTTTVTINDNTVTPAVVAFNNSTLNYTLTGTSGIGNAHTATLTKSGFAALTIANANSYSGGTTLNAGTLNLNNASAIGTGALTINGGTIDNTSASAITLSTNNAQNWNGDFTFGGAKDLNMGTGAVSLGGDRNITVNGGNLTVGGAVNGGSGLTKSGTGTLTLTGNNAYSGSTTLSDGTLVLGGSNSGGGSTTVNGGTLNVNPAGSIGSGGLTLNAGAVNINGAGSLGSGALALNGGTIDNTSGTALTLSGNNTQTWNGGFTFAGSNALNLGSGAVTLGGNTTVTTNANTLTVGGAIGGSASLTKAGPGTLTLTGVSSYSGGTVVNSGTLVLSRNGNSDGLGVVRGVLTVNSGATVSATQPNSIGWQGGVKVNTVNVNGGLFDSSASGDQGWGVAWNLTGGKMQTNAGVSGTGTAQLFAFGGGSSVNSFASGVTSEIAGRINLRESNTGNVVNFNVESGSTPSGVDLLVSAAITTNNTAYGISKSGAGTMVMTGQNTYTGPTTINAGTLQVGDGTTDSAIGGPIVNNSTLIYNVATSGTVSGAITGSGTFTKNGAGTLKLSSNGNSYTGATSVNAGKLIVSGSLSGTASVAVASGATLDVDGGMLSQTSGILVDGTLQGGGDGVTGGLVGGLTIDSNATLAPGKRTSTSTAGTLTAAGTVSFVDSSSVFSIRLGVGSASDNDKLAISGGNFVFLGGAQLQLTLGQNFSTQPIGFTYVLIDGGSSASIVGNFAQGSTINEPWGVYNILYGVDATGTTTGNDVVLQYVAVPEPQTWAMLAGGVGLLAFNNRLRRRK